MNELRPCDLCGASPNEQTPTWPDAAPGSAAFGYKTCRRCGMVQCNPLPGDGDMAAFHRDEYAADADQMVPDRLSKLDPDRSRARLYSPAYQRWARELLESVSPDVISNRKGPMRFLEVGCAAGGVLMAARDMGMSVLGTEVSPDAAEYGIRSQGFDIRIGTLDKLALPGASFDIVLLHDVIEHVPSPMDLMRQCARLLAPGGVVCVHTVNVASFTASVAKSRFFLADTTGGHVALFTPATLRRYCKAVELDVLSIKSRGFRIVQRERDRAAMGWNRALIRMAENTGHELVKALNRGHFVMLMARRPVQA